MTMMMKEDTVELELVEENSIAVIRLNRPNAMNAMNMQLATDFNAALDQLTGVDGLRAVVVTGNGKAFCAGGDLAAFKSARNKGNFLHELATKFHEAILKLRYLDAPFIAAINGPCYGVGLSLACACDFRIAVDTAKFSVAFTGVGLSPDSGLPYFLPRIVGLSIATELALLNPVIDTKRALEINLISIATEGDVVADGIELAKKLATMPTKALGAVKRLYNDAFSDPLPQHLEKEAQAVSDTAASEDFVEGCAAFFEKRKPTFTGK
ncbi:MAG TPA: enoyl-CoA hydratase-related protein [Candidatus Lokiarchaeia archaeon]|nr:enoyl-CoA hydratase-related protein [Candidatus Lokiarchaeia archaeon]